MLPTDTNVFSHFEMPMGEINKCNTKLGYPWVAGYYTAKSATASFKIQMKALAGPSGCSRRILALLYLALLE